jgi:hypothetical protein
MNPVTISGSPEENRQSRSEKAGSGNFLQGEISYLSSLISR